MPQFIKRTQLLSNAQDAFDWHSRSGAFERLSPPFDRVELVEKTGGIEPGSRVRLRVFSGPLPQIWLAEHRQYEPGRSFTDVQVTGPFARWEHRHSFIPTNGGCVLEDRIDYALPYGLIGSWLGAGFVRRKLDQVFSYRHAVTAHDLAAHFSHLGKGSMKILISGASGLVGTELKNFLAAGGHEVKTLGRLGKHSDVAWNVERNLLNAAELEGFDAVVHLAGENVAGGRWTPERRKAILNSRVDGTRLLCEALARCKRPPKVLVSASAVGIYGDRGNEELTESSSHGSGFLAAVCRAWEDACQPAIRAGIRVVNLRIGVVLSPRGGALKKMLLPFKLGLGSNLGTGRQWMSWISIDDLVGSIHHVLMTESVRGPVNACSPAAVQQREFARLLGKVLWRPTIRFLPSFMTLIPLWLVFGDMALEVLLGGAKVLPRRLQDSGYVFRHPDLEGALRHVLGKRGRVEAPVPAATAHP